MNDVINKRRACGVENMAKALAEASKLLHLLGVRHYLAFGTALGIYRDGELINWDWDIDFVCDGEDICKINKKGVEQAGFSGYKERVDAPISIINGIWSDVLVMRSISFKKYGCKIDVDPAYISNDGKFRIIPKGRKRAKFCAKHPISFFNNAKVIDYRGNSYLIPNPPEEYLESNYGKDWKIPQEKVTKWQERACLSIDYKLIINK